MYFADRLTLDAPRRTSDGYLAVRAKAARTGVYQYAGREVDPDNRHGLRDQSTVNVLRDDATVFDAKAVHSFIGKPITIDHPREAVTASNWKDHARGTIMGALRDGDHLAFDLLLMDAAAIADVQAGKRQLSNGYAAELEFGDFAAADGTKCPVRQARISSGNHVAVVDRARGGDSCVIADTASCESAPLIIFDSLQPQEKHVKTMLIDGLTVDISNADTAQATIATILAARDAATGKVAGLETQVATLTTDKATLEQQLKDTKLTPQQLRDAAKGYAITAGKAKALGVAITDAMDEPTIMKAVVLAKMGDTAKDWNDAQLAASFAVLAKDAKAPDLLRDAITASPAILADGAQVRNMARLAQYN